MGDAPELCGSDLVEGGAEDDALPDDESDGLAPTERLPCLVELCGVECAGLRGAFRHVCSVARRDAAVKYDDARGKRPAGDGVLVGVGETYDRERLYTSRRQTASRRSASAVATAICGSMSSARQMARRSS